MPITRQQKEEAVSKLKSKLSLSDFAVFLNFHGLSVAKASELRRALRKAGADYTVAKKTLFSIAASGAGLEVDKKKLEGEVAVASSGGGEEVMLAAAKEIAVFAKKNKDILKIIGGFWQKAWIGGEEVKRMASIPPRETLLTQLAFMLSQPAASLARVLSKAGEKNK